MGLLINDGSYYNGSGENALRLGFASLREKEMEEAIEILKRAYSLY
jgi:DNA-binding transcriptional MocR family regulator